MKVCAKCGRKESGKEFVGAFCTECFSREHELFRLPEVIELRTCAKCGRAHFKDWETYSLNAVRKLVLSKLRTPYKLADAKIMIEEKKEQREKFLAVHLDLEFDVDGNKISRKAQVLLRLEKEQCLSCSRISGGYFEAIVQVRGDAAKAAKMEKKIAELIEKEAGVITKIEEHPEGRDLYVSSKQAAHKALNELRLHVKASGKLAGKNREGKTLFRTTYCVRV